MRLSGYWFCCVSIIALLLLSCPVCGDTLIPTNTQVYFEKDGQPFNESVQFTVECYGYRCDWNNCTPPAGTGNISETAPAVIFSYSATCPGYGCTIYEPFYLNYRQIDRCDLDGVTNKGNFTLQNFSTTPLPQCNDFQQYNIGIGADYYRETPEFTRCENESYNDSDLCDQYVVPCNPTADKDCGNWIIDDKYVKDSPKSSECREDAHRKRRECEVYLKKVDPSSMVLWKNNYNGKEEPAMRVCEQRFSIPSSGPATALNQSIPGQNPGAPVSSTIYYQSPVESLYCGILSLFGTRCT
ncbi:MAG: hypothetical protein Q7T80_04460 [Methanoregula sp.]|nr:hypothetical protein [Methanoregula sp.]